jgi:hypothetical protein
MAELSLSHRQRYTFTVHLNRVRMAELVRANRRRTPASSAARCNWARIPAGAHGRPRVGPRRMQNNAPTARGGRHCARSREAGGAAKPIAGSDVRRA